jgi:hypothetical protein
MKILFVSAKSWDDIVDFQMKMIMVCQFSLSKEEELYYAKLAIWKLYLRNMIIFCPYKVELRENSSNSGIMSWK